MHTDYICAYICMYVCIYMYVLLLLCWLLSHVQLFETPWTVAHQAPLSMVCSRQETGMSCHDLLQRIFPTQGLNLGFLHCRWILYCLSHQRNPYECIHTYICIFFKILFHYSLLQDIDYSSLHYTVGSCCLSILYIVVCIYQSQTLILSLPPPFPFGNYKFVFNVCESVSVL